MKKLIVLGAGSAFAVAAATSLLFGAGIASAAPDVVGDTYSDAEQAISDSGGSVVVASRVGDKLDQGDCIVTNAWDASFLRIDSSDDSQVNVALNCNGGHATATNPGSSAQNPLGRASKEEQEAAEAEEQELAGPEIPDN
ncbi:hypothetical protein [Mycolicibacterium gadium]|uniref:Secreted protein n=1 Tax=Mycolicibacterium gadium TaxID=1794 RepID=A0A7I7WQ66_MYCGU|nr:hypothetical protein [Mycolicibacterium gadium]BBZ19202.1 hypothetical protein MGAD_35370 [Mycolicibacterium gadium]